MFALLYIFTIFFNYTEAHAADLKEIFKKTQEIRTQQLLVDRIQNKKLIIFIGYLEGCPNFRKYQNTLNLLHEKFKNDVLFVVFDPSKLSSKYTTDSLNDLKLLGNSMDFVVDPDAVLNAQLKIDTATQVVIFDLKNEKLLYRGAIDDRITFDYFKPKAEKKWLEDKIIHVLAGKTEKFSSSDVFGCALNIKKDFSK